MNKRFTIIVNIALGIIIAGKMTMKKTIKRSKLTKALRKLRIDSILPFKEKPSDDMMNKEKKDEMDASELFSFFTADIIKEDIEFVR